MQAAVDIVVTEFMDDASVDGLRGDFAVHYDPRLVDRRDDLVGALAGVRGLIVRNRTRVDAVLLAAAPDLVVVGRLGVGLDNIDLDACAARGIEVCPATGANDVAVAEYVIGAAITLLRPALLRSAEVVAGEWPRNRGIGREIAGATLGLVGYGGIARQVAVRAAALGMGVVACDPHVGDTQWDGIATRSHDSADLLAGSDVVSLHVPLTDATRAMVGAAELSAMRPHAVLINTARGGVVDEAALADALRAGRLGGAAIDVFVEEPLSAARARLFEGLGNVILTPHIAGLTGESNRRVGALTAANVRRVLGERMP